MAWNLLWGDSLAFDVTPADVTARVNPACGVEGYGTFGFGSIDFAYNSPLAPLTKTVHFSTSGIRYVFSTYKTWLYRNYYYFDGSSSLLLRVRDGSTDQVTLVVEVGGIIQLRRGTTVLLALPPIANGWHHIELAVSIGTSGSACVRVDYVSPYPFSGNTQVTGNAYADTIVPSGADLASNTVPFPYRCMCNPTFMESPVSNCLTEPFPPTLIWYPRAGSGNGAHQDLIASVGSAYTCINGLPPDDSKFISSGTPGDASTFTHDALVGLSCAGYIQSLRGKVLSGGALVAPVTDFGGVVYPGANVVLSTAFVTVPTTPVVVRPDNGMPISVADANATELGVKIIGVA